MFYNQVIFICVSEEQAETPRKGQTYHLSADLSHISQLLFSFLFLFKFNYLGYYLTNFPLLN
jgi:hypothetical protein